MLLKKYMKNRQKLKILLLLMIVALIVATLVLLSSSSSSLATRERLLDERFIAEAVVYGGGGGGGGGRAQALPQVQSQQERVPIVPEKYDEHKIKTRIIKDKIKYLAQQLPNNAVDPEEEHAPLDSTTSGIHIFYSAPVQWYKTKKTTTQQQQQSLQQQQSPQQKPSNGSSSIIFSKPKSPRILNTAFYPALGLYKPTTSLLQKHFENIRSCGIGVLILSHTAKPGEAELYDQILRLVPKYNLSVTFEFSLGANQTQAFVRQQLEAIRRYSTAEGFYRVHSLSRNSRVPVLYVSNAYKLSDEAAERIFCSEHLDNERKTLDALFIGHIRLKSHADSLRRLCFDGFYSKLPSNGATYASTWKNWSYLKSFAQTYKMLFVPTVGPGFAERNKFPRHGDIQRHRSNGRYYGVAWRTAIINHVGFISIASYNNWQDGSQIEEVVAKAGFLDYNPGSKTKYLDLTTHWVGNFLKTRREAFAGRISCYEFLNNTIC